MARKLIIQKEYNDLVICFDCDGSRSIDIEQKYDINDYRSITIEIDSLIELIHIFNEQLKTKNPER